MQSEGQKEAATLQRQLAEEAKSLFATGEPYLKKSLDDFIKDLGASGEEPASIKKSFETIRQNMDKQFTQQEDTLPTNIKQMTKQSGYRGARGSVDEASRSALLGLEQRRRAAKRQLDVQETDAAMAQRDFDLGSILNISSGGISGAFGLARNAISASAYDTRNPGQGALSGATAGAALGTEIYPGIGTAIGAVGGGLVGYFAGGG